MADSQDKTEKATPKKRKDARKKGQVFSSKDVVNLASMAVLFTLIKMLFPLMYEQAAAACQYFVGEAADISTFTGDTGRQLFFFALVRMVIMIMPVAVVAALAGVLATGVQTRFLFAKESMKPKFERINILKGLKRMLSLRSIVELIKNIIKFAVIAVVIYRFVKNHLVPFSRMLDMGIMASAVYFLQTLYSMCMQICLFFGIVAFADYLYQRWDYEKNLKMSKQEVKEEYKQLEGNPEVKSRIKEIQRQFSQRRMMQQVPEADVIIRNPTHYAVAMKYDPEKDIAPRVVAKGADEQAMRIVRTGEEHGVFIKEDPELTRAIYASTDIGDLIPYEYYNAVADLLAFIYRMNRAKL